MSERAVVKVRLHYVRGWLWAQASCSHAHEPEDRNAPLPEVLAWIDGHLRARHKPEGPSFSPEARVP